MQGFGQLLERVDLLANGDKTSVQARVRADFKAGSFEFIVDFIQFVSAAVVPMLAGSGITAIVNGYQLMQILFGHGNGSLLELLRFLVGAKPHKVEKADRKVLVFKDGNKSIAIHESAYTFFDDQKVRSAIGMAIADSLSRRGIDSLTVSSRDISAKVLQSEVGNFYFPPTDAETFEEEILEAELEILGVSFEKGRKWDFRSYKEAFTAEIVDEVFWNKVYTKEAFQKGDKLKVILRIEFYRTELQIRKRRTILKVIDHFKPDVQLNLDLPS